MQELAPDNGPVACDPGDRLSRANLFQPRDDKTGIIAEGLPVMNLPEPAVRPASNSGPARRIAVAVILSTVLFTVLWTTMFSVVTSLLIAAGCGGVIVAASSASDVVEMLLDAVSTVIFGIVAVIAAIFGAIFSIFDF
jgi:hypothetical protein